MKRVLTIALVLAAGLGLAGCTDDEPEPGEAAGPATVLGASTPVRGTATVVAVPDGRFEFSVTEPVGDLPLTLDGYDRAGAGASFVGVTWNWDFTAAVPVTRTPGAPQVVPSVSVLIGERAYPIDEVLLAAEDEAESPVAFSGTAWVAVEGEPDDVDDVALRVEYDGLRQDVPVGFPTPASTDRGVAAPLYRSTDQLVRVRGRCGESRPGTTVSCSTTRSAA